MKCAICKKKGKWRFSPDLDIRGIGTCEKHRKDVHTAYIALITGEDDSMFWSLIEGHKDYVKD